MAKAKQAVKLKRSDAYTIDTPQVKAFLDYLSTDKAFETPHEYNAYTYSEKTKLLKPRMLYRYTQIEGFSDEITRRKDAYAAKERLRIIKIAKAGLEKLAAGKAERKTKTVYRGEVTETVEVLEPHQKACIDLLKINDAYDEKITVINKFDNVIKAAAELIDKEEIK